MNCVTSDLKPKFLNYKELKKQLKGLLPGTPANTENGPVGAGTPVPQVVRRGSEEAETRPELLETERQCECCAKQKAGQRQTDPASIERENARLTPDECAFLSKLNLEIIKFNDYFIQREEEMVIRVKELRDRLAQTSASEDGGGDVQDLGSQLVHLHGEILLLLHWCELNYIGLVKILKKHDKKTGLLLRSPFLANVVKQPFCSTTILKRLVKQVEDTIIQIVEGEEEGGAGDVQMIHDMADGHGQGAAAESLPQLVITLGDDSEDELDSGAGILKQTRVAINLWQTMQKSKTPGGQQFVPVVEQTRGVRGQKREQGEQGEERQRQKKQRGECACCLKGDCC